MPHIAVVCEGQTEEQFVTRVLAPYLLERSINVQPIVSKHSRGGGGNWTPYDRCIRTLLGESHRSTVTTMLDFYGYPRGAPGRECCDARPGHVDPRGCAVARQEAMTKEITDRRFVPFVMLHEFETLVFAAALGRDSLLGRTAEVAEMRRQAATVESVELLNDSPQTSPSKRIQQCWSDFRKTDHGVAAIEEAGLDAVLASCPHFAEWVRRLVISLD